MTGPDQTWIQRQANRVTEFYQSRAARFATPDRCGQLCWPDGPRCELPPHPADLAHVAPSVASQPGIKFIGPVPSSRRGHPAYTVTVYDDPIQRATCTCEGYTKYHRGQDCSHIRLVREAIALS